MTLRESSMLEVIKHLQLGYWKDDVEIKCSRPNIA
jgi:hypothetical protein